MEAFKTNQIASSIAHGAAVSLAWNADLSQISKFYTTKDDDAGCRPDGSRQYLG